MIDRLIRNKLSIVARKAFADDFLKALMIFQRIRVLFSIVSLMFYYHKGEFKSIEMTNALWICFASIGPLCLIEQLGTYTICNPCSKKMLQVCVRGFYRGKQQKMNGSLFVSNWCRLIISLCLIKQFVICTAKKKIQVWVRGVAKQWKKGMVWFKLLSEVSKID